MNEYLRRCRKHQLNLEEYGDHLVCPAGETHICEDFVVIDRKTGAVVNEVPEDEAEAPKARPVGSADVTRMLGRSVVPKKETNRMSEKAHKRGEPFPHGTHQRYFQEVKSDSKPCEPCRLAAAQYSKDRRDARLLEAGKTPRVPAAKAPAKKQAPRLKAVKKAEIVKATSDPSCWLGRSLGGRTSGREGLSLSAMANEIEGMRRDLAKREAAFAAAVTAILPNYKLINAVEVELVQAISETRRGRVA